MIEQPVKTIQRSEKMPLSLDAMSGCHKKHCRMGPNAAASGSPVGSWQKPQIETVPEPERKLMQRSLGQTAQSPIASLRPRAGAAELRAKRRSEEPRKFKAGKSGSTVDFRSVMGDCVMGLHGCYGRHRHSAYLEFQ